MRWFFLILLAVNLLYVTWELRRERPVANVPPPLPAHVDRLVLLSELASSTVPQTSGIVATAEVAEAAPVRDEVQQQTGTNESASVQVAAPGNTDATEDDAIGAELQAEAAADKPVDHPVDEPARDLCDALAEAFG